MLDNARQRLAANRLLDLCAAFDVEEGFPDGAVSLLTHELAETLSFTFTPSPEDPKQGDLKVEWTDFLIAAGWICVASLHRAAEACEVDPLDVVVELREVVDGP